jgi:hypothetical protein
MAVNSLFLGAYWKVRKESRMECATRLSNYLRAIGSVESLFQKWFQKASRRPDATNAADLSIEGLHALLKTNDRDVGGEPIVELGFNLSLWNGANASFSAVVGAFSPYIENSIVLSFRGDGPFEGETWRRLIEKAVEAFDPDSAVVTSDDYIASHGGGAPVSTPNRNVP